MLQQFTTFKGELPRASARLLPDDYAQLAVNCRMETGALEPINASTFVTDLVTPRDTIYLNGATWLAYAGTVAVLPGPTATDRLYIFGDGVPRMRANDTNYPLALPAPATAPTIANRTAPDEDALETILYAVTYVTSFGEESAPSPLSNALEWSEGVIVDMTDIPAPPAGRAITKMRIYRSNTSATGVTDLFFVEEADVATTYSHDLNFNEINEVIATTAFTTPPDDLRGVISMPNGMFVGHTDREILFCEPYQPQAWPSAYRLLVDYDIVGLAAFGSQLAVMTKGTPYRGQGSHPDTFQLERIEENLPCVSARSIVDLGYAAAYASTDGLVTITGTGAQVVSKPLFTPKHWHQMDPASMFAAQHKGRYVFGFTGSLPSGDETCGIVDLSGDTPFFLRSGIAPVSFYHDLRTSILYYQASADNKLYHWDDYDAPASMSLSWKSAPLDVGFPIGFAAVYLEGEATGAFSCTIIADGNNVATVTTLNQPVRLPSGFKSQHWEVAIEGMVTITTAAIATSLSDLASLR